ncbi:MAG: acetylxylan esterase [Clostridia bacterium]|nr:acetylxylan esterase [Clostridia bacterium]
MNLIHPLSVEQNICKNMQPQLQYKDGAPFSEWQKQGKEKLFSLLGLQNMMPCEALFEIEYEKEHAAYREIRFVFQSEEGYFVPCHLLLPNACLQTVPLMICLQGHSKGMHISLGKPKYEGDEESIGPGIRDFCIQAVQNGFAAVAMEQRCFGECGGTPNPDCQHTALTAIANGRTVIGERVWDVARLIDVIENRFPTVDKDRIYCMGNSGGGTATLYAAALEDRIKAAIPSCAVCTYSASIYAHRHCACNYIPQITQWFDMGDLCGLCAPKPLLIVSGREDSIFPIDGAVESYETAKKIYTAADAAEKVMHCIGPNGHRFYAELAWPAFIKML